jgi:hypothetical protein
LLLAGISEASGERKKWLENAILERDDAYVFVNQQRQSACCSQVAAIG